LELDPCEARLRAEPFMPPLPKPRPSLLLPAGPVAALPPLGYPLLEYDELLALIWIPEGGELGVEGKYWDCASGELKEGMERLLR
jgi:hypothetical protein